MSRKPDKGMFLQGKYLAKEFNDAQGQLRDIVRCYIFRILSHEIDHTRF
jgi:hypothetical protein